MKKTYVLDACAVIALLTEEPGYEVVAELYEQSLSGTINLIVHRITLLEIYYKIFARRGYGIAEEILQDYENSSISIEETINIHIFRCAGNFKAKHSMSLADAVALATAMHHSGALVTADHKDFDRIQHEYDVDFLWIR